VTTAAIRPARLVVTLDGMHTVSRPLVEVATGTPVTAIGVIDFARTDGDGILLRLVGDDETSAVVRISTRPWCWPTATSWRRASRCWCTAASFGSRQMACPPSPPPPSSSDTARSLFRVVNIRAA
jgi:hypothetical protein